MVGELIPDRQKKIAMRLVDDGKLTMKECVDYDFFSTTTGWRVRKEWEANNHDLAPKTFHTPAGRPRVIDLEAQEFIRKRIERQCDLTLEQLRKECLAYNKGDFTISTIWWCLKRMRLSHKGMEKFAIEQDAQERLAFRQRIAQYPPQQLVFIDESSVDWRAAHRRFGRAPVGERCRKAYPLTRGKRYTVLPAISLSKGVFALGIYESPFGGDDLYYHIKKVLLPELRPWPEDNSVIVLDNCPYHHVRPIKDLVESYGECVTSDKSGWPVRSSGILNLREGVDGSGSHDA